MSSVTLPALSGTNPLGYLAALGALDVLERRGSGPHATLAWTEELIPCAVLGGVGDLEELIAHCDADRRSWRESAVLAWEDDGRRPADLKLDPDGLRRWAAAVVAEAEESRAPADLFCSLVAEGAVAHKGDAKPTHLDFTAGNQRFLEMARHLAAGVSPADLDEALRGPWAYTSTLPSFGWDARGERIYALRATDPAGEKRPGTPGADWLAFLGLTFFPTATSGRSLLTTGCGGDWKHGWLTWPLWSPSLGVRTIRSLMGDPTIVSESIDGRRSRGISMVLRAPIRRTDQGGYGSFGPATLVTGGDGSPVARNPRRGESRR